MKKVLVGILAGMVLVSLCGCSGNDQPVPETESTVVAETASTDTTEIVYPENWENMSKECQEEWLYNTRKNVYFGQVAD